MQWTEPDFLLFVEKQIGEEEAALLQDFLAALKKEDQFSIRSGKGRKFPSLRIYAENLSAKYQIIGIESYKLFTREAKLHVWVNLTPHEKNHPHLILKIRNFLGEPKKKFPYLGGENPKELIGKINLILDIIRSNF